jgi:beta-glucosidase-like glycosyl hydrolase
VAGNPWGVQGAWITDDLEMGGCGDWPWPERIRLAMEAGHQALLVCHSQEAIDQTVAALRALPSEITGPAVQAGQAYRRTLTPPSQSPFDEAAWDAWVLRVQEAAS